MFSFLNSKKTLLDFGIPQRMADIHSHLLPGVDDGAKQEDESIALIEKLHEFGVKKLVLTPHIMMNYPENNANSLKAHFDEFKQKYNGKVELFLASEYMLDEGFSKHLSKGLLTYDGQRALVETSFMGCSMSMVHDLLFKMSAKKYIPVLAHPERYAYMKAEDYLALLDYGCEFQLNIAALAGRYGKKVQDTALAMLKNDMYTYAASDIHGERHLGVYDQNLLDKKTYERLLVLLENNNALCSK